MAVCNGSQPSIGGVTSTQRNGSTFLSAKSPPYKHQKPFTSYKLSILHQASGQLVTGVLIYCTRSTGNCVSKCTEVDSTPGKGSQPTYWIASGTIGHLCGSGAPVVCNILGYTQTGDEITLVV